MSYTHGGDIYGSTPVRLDFSVNTNRLGMPQAVRSAVMASADAWEQYPDALCRKLRRAAADFYASDGTPIPENWLVFGNGASDILYAVVAAIQPKQAILLAPGFSEYEQALRMCGCRIQWLYLKEEDGFSLKGVKERLYAMLAADSKLCAGETMLILGNPNNPTGNAVPASMIAELAEICRKKDTWLLVDECFQWFLDARKECSFVGKLLAQRLDRVILLNALTKICSMAGLRLGYGIIPNADLREQLEKCRQPWSVSAPAQAGGEAAFEELADRSEKNLLERTQVFLRTERPWLADGLEKADFSVYPSQANYLLFRSQETDFHDYKQACLQQGILIRACENFKGLNRHYYRVAVRSREENKILLDTLNAIR